MNLTVWTLIHCVPNPLWVAESIAAFWAQLSNIWFSKFGMRYRELHFNMWNHAVRKTSNPLFSKWMNADCTLFIDCFLFNNHRCKPSASAHSNICRKPKSHSQARKRQKITWSWIQVSSATLHLAATKETHWPTAILLLASIEICSKPLQMKPSCLSSIPDVFYSVWLW